MSISLLDNLKVNAGKPLDSLYLNSSNQPYSSIEEVLSGISISKRYIGLTVNVNGDEYWFYNGVIDDDFVKKLESPYLKIKLDPNRTIEDGFSDVNLGTNSGNPNSPAGGNITIGQNVLQSLVTSGSFISAPWYSTFRGDRNVAIGYDVANKWSGMTSSNQGTSNIMLGVRPVANTLQPISYSVVGGFEPLNKLNKAGNTLSTIQSLIVFGTYALSGSTINGGYNIGIGHGAGQGASLIESYEILIGGAGKNASLGRGNIGIGELALNNSKGGVIGAIGIGRNQFNVAIGTHTMENSGPSEKGTFVGTEAGSGSVIGYRNSGFGNWALPAINGSNNTGIGAYAGYMLTSNTITGNCNTFIGPSTGVDPSTINITGVTVIGNAKTAGTLTGFRPVAESETIYIGSTNNIVLVQDYDDTPKTITFDSNGMRYGGDYSSGFTKHSIVDVNYLTGITSQIGGSSFSNGIILSGGTAMLGGVITNNTTILVSGETGNHFTFETRSYSQNEFKNRLFVGWYTYPGDPTGEGEGEFYNNAVGLQSTDNSYTDSRIFVNHTGVQLTSVNLVNERTSNINLYNESISIGGDSINLYAGSFVITNNNFTSIISVDDNGLFVDLGVVGLPWLQDENTYPSEHFQGNLIWNQFDNVIQVYDNTEWSSIVTNNNGLILNYKNKFKQEDYPVIVASVGNSDNIPHLAFKHSQFRSLNDGFGDISLGTQAGSPYSPASGNITIGQKILQNISPSSSSFTSAPWYSTFCGDRNIAIGYDIGNQWNFLGSNQGTSNILFGIRTVNTQQPISYSIFGGFEAGNKINKAGNTQSVLQNMIALGTYALSGATVQGDTNSNSSVIIGHRSGYGATLIESSEVLIGGAGERASLGRGNIGIGQLALANAKGGTVGASGVGKNQFNVAVGIHTMENAGPSEKGTFVGTEAGSVTVIGSKNTGVGSLSLTRINGDHNTGIGAYAGYMANTTISGNCNTFIGPSTGVDPSTVNITGVTVIGNAKTASTTTGFRPVVESETVYVGSTNNIVLTQDYDGSSKTVIFNSNGMNYGGDYSSGFTKHTLVDVNYVTGITSQNFEFINSDLDEDIIVLNIENNKRFIIYEPILSATTFIFTGYSGVSIFSVDLSATTTSTIQMPSNVRMQNFEVVANRWSSSTKVLTLQEGSYTLIFSYDGTYYKLDCTDKYV